MIIRTLTRHDHLTLLNFLDRQPDVHYHLDWQPVEEWLKDPEALTVLAWEEDLLVAAMAFTPPHGGTTWMRLLALPHYDRPEIFRGLWAAMRPLLQGQTHLAASMIHRHWVAEVLAESGFTESDAVINLLRLQQPVPRVPLAPVQVRRPRRWETGTILAIDHAAFGPLWQMRAHDLREASRRASHYTVALDDGRIVGYQLSIRYGRSVHLARLAILPECQSQGVGSTLVHDLLNYAQDNNIEQVTVNTQRSNVGSQRLYHRMGFEPDGSSLPVFIWTFA